MKTTFKHIFLSFIPSLVLGFGFFYLVSLLNGMDKIESTSLIWLFLGTDIFIFRFVSKNNGKNIFARFLRYAAYECWISPFCVLIYTMTSIFQANNSLGAIGITIGGFFLIPIFIGVGGLLGLILYLISKSIMKNANEQTQKPDETIIKISQCTGLINKQTRDRDEKILKILQWTLPTFVALILIFGITSNLNEKKEVITNVPNISPPRGYILTPKESKILNITLNEDSSYFGTGKPSALDKITKLPILSIAKIARAYNENQVAADQEYFKKELHISGVIKEINSGLGNEPYLTFYGAITTSTFL